MKKISLSGMGALLLVGAAAVMGCSRPGLVAPVGPTVYIHGEGGYNTYRIPALAVTKAGTVLAFCEGRKRGSGDSGDIDLLVKRSGDHGV